MLKICRIYHIFIFHKFSKCKVNTFNRAYLIAARLKIMEISPERKNNMGIDLLTFDIHNIYTNI